MSKSPAALVTRALARAARGAVQAQQECSDIPATPTQPSRLSVTQPGIPAGGRPEDTSVF